MDSNPATHLPEQPAYIPNAVAPAAERQTPKRRGRIDSIDLLRGIVMVIMVLDHTRDFVHRESLQFMDPTDLSRTNVMLFFTRWITHFCAPVFVLLAGTGTYLQLSRGKSKGDLSKFLVTRGLWLIVLEFTVVRLGVFFNFDYRYLGAAQVIWVLGVSMIVLALLIHLPVWLVAVFGIGMIGLHNLLDSVKVPGGWQGPESPVPTLAHKLWFLLHQPFEAFPVAGFPSPVLFVVYPLIPWIGVMAAGYALGKVYDLSAERRRRVLLMLGIGLTLLFIAVRATNIYGDPSKWSTQSSAVFTILSFVNTTKYPASLLFLLMTIGPSLIALAWFDQVDLAGLRKGIAARIRNFFITFGRVPLFFYLLQWYFAHLIAVIVHLIAARPVRWMFGSAVMIAGAPPDVGFNLAVVYACWIAGVLLLYPLCKAFADLKAVRKDWWLSYL